MEEGKPGMGLVRKVPVRDLNPVPLSDPSNLASKIHLRHHVTDMLNDRITMDYIKSIVLKWDDLSIIGETRYVGCAAFHFIKIQFGIAGGRLARSTGLHPNQGSYGRT